VEAGLRRLLGRSLGEMGRGLASWSLEGWRNGEGEAEVLVRAGLRNGLGWRGGRFIDGTSKGTEQE
jgi:hypothetical protein